jgi:hypothetical protein
MTYTSDDVFGFHEWTKNTMKDLFILEDKWLWENIQQAGMTYGDVGIKTRCKVVKQNKAHIWTNTLYIDDRIVSIMVVNSVTLEATIENADGFTSKGTIKMLNATINDRTLEQALARADKVEQELTKIVQVVPSDWDVVILAKEVKRLKELKDG